MKRFITCLMVVFIAGYAGASSSSVAAQYTDAQTLNMLGIVKGDGGDFLEDKTLTRAEAVTLILRLSAEAASDSNSSLSFADVKDGTWYYDAVYEAADQGIVNGYPDGTFRPDDVVSRRAFLKMILEVQGYDYKTDFLWEEVDAYGVAENLITDEYDAGDFVRRDAFNIIVNLLKRPLKDSGVQYIEAMKTQGIITAGQYDSVHEIMSFSNVEIEAVKVPVMNHIVIGFSEDIAVDIEDVSVVITDRSSKAQKTVSEIRLLTASSLDVKTESLSQSAAYDVEVRGIKDRHEFAVGTLVKSFSPKESSTDYEFYLKSAVLNSTRHILLTFSRDVKDAYAASKYFRLYKNDSNIFFNVVKQADNQLLLIMNEDASVSDKLEVEIKGFVTDIYYNTFMDGYTVVTDVVAADALLNELRFGSVKNIGNGIMQVVFNMPVDPNSGMNKMNYEIRDMSTGVPYFTADHIIASGTGEYKNRQFDIVHEEFVDGHLYFIKISNISSLGRGYVLETQKERFTYEDKKVTFSIQSASAADDQHCVIRLSQPITEKLLGRASVKLDGIIAFRKHVDMNNPFVLHVYSYKSMDPDESHSVSIKDLESQYGFVMEASKSFSGTETVRKDIVVTSKTLASGDYLYTFNRIIKDFVENEDIKVDIIYASGDRMSVEQEYLTVLSDNEMILDGELLTDEVVQVVMRNVYLYGDDYSAGTIELYTNIE